MNAAFQVVELDQLPPKPTHCIKPALEAAQSAGKDKAVKVTIANGNGSYLQKAAHTYAERSGMIITTSLKGGFLFIRYLGSRLPFKRDAQPLDPDTRKILRGLGR